MRNSTRVISLMSILVLLSISVFLTIPFSVMAIGEVTPTPTPAEVEPEIPDEVDVQALLEEALVNIQDGEFRSAIAKMDIVIEFDPTITAAFYLRGIAATQLGFLDDALEDFSAAIELEPWRYDLFLFRGDVYSVNGSATDALLDYTEAIAINPFAPDAFERRTSIYYELDADDAGDVDDLIAQALRARLNGQVNEAMAFLDEAIAIGNEDSIGMAYYIRAITGLALGDNDAVLVDYALAVEFDPDLHQVYLARGILYRQQNNIKAAGRDFYNRITILSTETLDEEMAIGDTIHVEMAYRRAYAISFEGEAGQVISILASDSGDTFVDPLIALLDPDGEAIAGDDDFGGGLSSLIDDFELPDDGTYTLILGHAEGGRSTGFRGLVEISISE